MKRLTYIFFCTLLIAALAMGCDEPIDLDAEQIPPKIVIEGLVTNKPNYQFVKVSRSTDFYQSGKTPRVTDAVVTVTDDAGGEFVFTHNPRNHPDSMGIYIPEQNFVGTVGRTYTLHVTADGRLYEATDKLLSVTAIDSIEYQVNEDQEEEPEEPGKIYELLLYAKEPQDEKNYYLFKYYRNDTLIVFNPTDIYYSNDDLTGENISGVPSPVFFGRGDNARLELYSLTRRGYVYYNDLFTILNGDTGGMFGPVPAPPRTNLTNDALGFFQVSAINEMQVFIE